MLPNTRANKKRHRGVERWRCQACLFELPEDLIPESLDLPYEEDFVPDHDILESGNSDVLLTKFNISIERGCKFCRSIRDGLTGGMYGGMQWVRGGIGNIGYGSTYQIFLKDHPSSSTYPLSFHPYVDSGNYPTGDTRSQEAFNRAASWIQRCQNEHQRCAQGSKRKRMPKRILFINDFASLKVRLIENADKLPPRPYVCLSHRWMPETKAISLTSDRAKVFQRRIPRETFYPLLADAVEATHRLGFQYLWIDCLCIYQDNLQDWHIEASKMSEVYENAAVTLSALSSGPSSNKGLFSQEAPQKTSDFEIQDRSIISVRHMAYDSHPFQPNLDGKLIHTILSDNFPLLERGWVFQERLLSKRVIYFTKHELIWECNEALWCECQFMKGIWKEIKPHLPTISDLNWTDIIRDYSKTTLSMESDRLPAISGIAKRFGEGRGWTYLGGLWQEELMKELMWAVNQSSVQRKPPKPRELPSWSWASVMGPQVFFELDDRFIKVISYKIHLGPNPFGVPKSAKLVLEGPCIPGTLIYGPDMKNAFDDLILKHTRDNVVVVLKVGNVFLRVTCDYSFTEPGDDHIASGTQVLFMVGNFRDEIVAGFVLLSVDPLEASYERVGIAMNSIFLDDLKKDELPKKWNIRRITFL